MGAGSSVEVPGGGSEGYHVLRVSEIIVKCQLVSISKLNSGLTDSEHCKSVFTQNSQVIINLTLIGVYFTLTSMG